VHCDVIPGRAQREPGIHNHRSSRAGSEHDLHRS
jgi:hypothetical protein